MTTDYIVLSIKVTSKRVETAQCAAQSGPGEAKLSSWKYFPKMAKCGKGDGLVMNLNFDHTFSIL